MKVTIEGTLEQVSEALGVASKPEPTRYRMPRKRTKEPWPRYNQANDRAEIFRCREIVSQAFKRARSAGDKEQMAVFLRMLQTKPPLPADWITDAEMYRRSEDAKDNI
jgi:hypothetical protein